MKILISNSRLSEINTFEQGHPHIVDVLDSYSELSTYLSFLASQGGYPNVEKFLDRNKMYSYNIVDNCPCEERRLTKERIGN